MSPGLGVTDYTFRIAATESLTVLVALGQVAPTIFDVSLVGCYVLHRTDRSHSDPEGAGVSDGALIPKSWVTRIQNIIRVHITIQNALSAPLWNQSF